MKPAWGPLWGLLLAALLSHGCARVPSRPAPLLPPIASGGELLARLQEQAEAARNLQAKGQFFLLTPEKNFQGTARFLIGQPDRLRLEVLNFWGQSLVTFLSTGKEFQFLVYPEGKLYKGPATAANLHRFVPLPVTLPELLAIMTGGIAYEEYQNPELLPDTEPEVYQLSLTSRNGQGRVLLQVAKTGLQPLAARWLDPQEKEELRATWSDFENLQGTWLPREVRLATAGDRYQLRLRYRDLQPGLPLTPAALELPRLDGVKELPFPQ